MSAAEFSQALDSLLSSLSTPDRTLVMFELPLLPHKIGFGQAQRRLSSKYGVVLIPKHFFTQVLSGADATSDGLHLSESGARRMGALVARILSPVLKPAEPATRESLRSQTTSYPARLSALPLSPTATTLAADFFSDSSSSRPIILKYAFSMPSATFCH